MLRFLVALYSSGSDGLAQPCCATVWRMDDTQDALDALDAGTRKYRRTEQAHEKARDEAIDAVVAALKQGVKPTEVTKRSPFSAAYVRRIARDHGIEPATKGR